MGTAAPTEGIGKLGVDATMLFKALLYQILVAIEYCHDLADDEHVWIEVYGDVTVSGRVQVEVKYHDKPLTDASLTFWNTLKNWIKPEFEHEHYASLVLLTKQQFGVDTVFKQWDSLDVAGRIAELETVLAGSRAEHIKHGRVKPSESLKLQELVLDPAIRPALVDIIGKVKLTTGATNLDERLQAYVTRYLKPINPVKRQAYIDDLFGFMVSTERINNGWKISCQDFSEKLDELNARHSQKSTKFPEVDLDSLKRKVKASEVEGMRFVQKLRIIGADDEVKQAQLARLVASETLSQLYKEGRFYQSDERQYRENHLAMHVSARARNMVRARRITDEEELKEMSLEFYFDRIAMPPEQLAYLESTSVLFRNGIYHHLADEEPEDERDEFQWKLWT